MSSGDTLTQRYRDTQELEQIDAHPCVFELVSDSTNSSGSLVRWDFDQRIIRIGSLNDADLRLTDATVSRQHARVEVEQSGYRVIDTESKNGVWVNQVRARDAYLNDGDLLRIGGVQLRFYLAKQHVSQFSLWMGDELGELYGASTPMRELFALIDRVSRSEISVLLQGESGTGKELAARAIHERSERRACPFIVFDCSAAPSALIESELFGHTRGAFTGALESRLGAFTTAEGGTLLLDEVGELPLDLQPKLLRALERREVKRLGEDDYHTINVRVISATHRDLKAEVTAGRFRADLYYRLAVVELNPPPLREHPEDIPGLVERLIRAYSPSVEREVSFKTMSLMLRHDWPGNVRELKNYVLRALALSAPETSQLDTRFLLPDALASMTPEHAHAISGVGLAKPRHITPQEPQEPQDLDLSQTLEPGTSHKAFIPVDLALSFKRAKKELIEHFERRYWSALLNEHQFNISAAARAAGIHRKSAEYLLKKLNIKPERGRSSTLSSPSHDETS